MATRTSRESAVGPRRDESSLGVPLVYCFLTLGFSVLCAPVYAQTPLRVERLKIGDVYSVTTRGKMDGRLELPGQGGRPARQVPIVGSAHVVFRERVLRSGPNGALDRIFRIYDDADYQRKIDDQEQETKLRSAIRGVVVDFAGLELRPFSTDGSLTYAELEFLRTHPILPILEGFLPSQPVVVGAVWDVPRLAASHLLDVDPIRNGDLNCKYSGDIDFADKRLAQFAFAGSILGRTTEGEAKSEVVGAVYIDLATRRVHSLRAVGDRTMLGASNEPVGKIRVDYQITVRPNPNDGDLSDAIVGKLPAQPTAAELAVLYEHPGVGIRLRHPRGWMLANVEKGQFKLETKGGVVVLTPEPPGGTPTIKDYAAKVAQYLAKMEAAQDAQQRISVLNKSEPQEANNATGRAGNFRYRVKIGADERFLDYWVRETGRRGVTASARLTPDSLERLAMDVAGIVGSIEFFEPLKSAQP